MFDTFNSDISNNIVLLQNLLKKNKEKIEILLKIKQKTFDNFIVPLEILDDKLVRFLTPLIHINAVENSELSQDIYSQSLPLLSEYSSDIGQDIRLFNAYKAILNEEEVLNDDQKEVINQSLLSFKLSGASLSKNDKKRFKEISLRKSELSNDFSQNVLDATNNYELIIENKNDVAEIPVSDLAIAEFKDNEKTKYKFTLQIPSYIAYMTYGNNRKLREEIYTAYMNRSPQNSIIIDELLRLKQEQSKLLGFNSFAQYSLASKMVSDIKTVDSFLKNLAKASKPQALEELKVLEEMAKEDGIEKIESFDVAYYSEKLKKDQYNLDQEKYRPYFEQHKVVNGLFDFLENLFGFSFVPAVNVSWNDFTNVYDIKENNKTIARIYLDLEARKNKRGGAWMDNWQTHCLNENKKEELASAFVVCNFPPATKQNPSLLRHDDVVTLFHEMGHAIHHLLSKVNYNSISGVNGVEWDAVEFPSQFLENFAYEPRVLKMFATHYKNNETLSDEMIDKIVKSKNFQSAMQMLRQVEFALFDFTLHQDLYQKEEVNTLLNNIRKDIAVMIPPSNTRFQNAFSHIFAGGYSAGYYSYKWAEVLSADAFYKFLDDGIFTSDIASKYRNIILAKGGSRSMGILFKELMGRDLDTSALLRLSGIQ